MEIKGVFVEHISKIIYILLEFMKRKICIIGAGPAGLTAGWQLSKAGCTVVVFESTEDVGGMSRSFDLWGKLVDVGPHRFFSSDPRVNQLWLDAVGDSYEMISRITRIVYNKKFYSYPLKPFNALKNIGIFQSVLCIVSYLKARIIPTDARTFEGWVINKFGFKLYSIFFKSYSEKLWGIKCNELDADFATQRIKKFSMFEAIRSMFARSSNHKTLVDEFAYPYNGCGMPYKRMSKFIIDNGGSVNLKHKISGFEFNEMTGKWIVQGENFADEYDEVISTMPLTIATKYLNPNQEVLDSLVKLKFRNTILVYLKINKVNLFPDQWIYVQSPDVLTGRITNFSNWSNRGKSSKDFTILCMEYWFSDSDSLWNANDIELKNLAISELQQLGMVDSSLVEDAYVLKVPKSYPVYFSGYKNSLEVVKKFLSKFPKIQFIGRYGSYKYNNQDHSILMGILAADNILNGTGNDLWTVNTDYEYQEGCKITATGLVKS
ncbi:MAG: hypothetical protein EoVTN8_403 [Fluviibacter phosphoraccumulans EoVTN8]